MNRENLDRLKRVTPKKVARKLGYEVNNYKTHLKRQKAKNKLLKTFDSPPAFAITYDELSLITRSIVFLDDKEIPALFSYGQNAKTLVEIGAAFGASSSVLLASMPLNARLFSIDPFIVDSMGTWNASEKECKRSVSRLLKAVDKEEALERWSLLVEPSYEAVKKWDKKIDLMFIDGDHHYSSVKKDFEDWLPHIKKGGLILIHDSRRAPATPPKEYNKGWPGPTKLAGELRRSKQVRLVDEIHSITVWRKL